MKSSHYFGILITASILTVGGLLSGCASRHVQAFEGPPRSLSEVSLLSVRRMRGAKLSFLEIDGVSTRNIFSSMSGSRAGAVTARLLPGKHRVSVIMLKRLYQTGADLWWVAEAGQSYEVRGTDFGDKALIEIFDLTTGRRVGGIVGGIDEPAN